MTTETEIKSWIEGYVRDFDGQCQALMWQLASRFGTVVATPPSAISAWNTEKAAGRTRGGTPPPGAFAYFDIGVYGHVGFMLNAGRIFMGTTHVDEQWSDCNTGPQGLNDYCALTGARYLGWSYQNGGNSVPFTPDAGIAGGDIEPIEEKKEHLDMRIIYNKDAPSSQDDTRRAIVGELTFQVITAAQSTRERKIWGDPVNFTKGEWDACRDLVIARAKSLGLPVSTTPDGSVLVDYEFRGIATPKVAR